MDANVNKEGQEKFVIDCDADPFVPKGYSIKEHQNGGQFEWDPTKIKLYVAERQGRSSIEGTELRKELAGKPVMNACVLDFLLEHRDLIPEEWKDKKVFFWGTIYQSLDEGWVQLIRGLSWKGDKWGEDANWINPAADLWFGDSPAALREAA